MASAVSRFLMMNFVEFHIIDNFSFGLIFLIGQIIFLLFIGKKTNKQTEKCE